MARAYQANSRGMAELGRSSGVGAAMVEAAERGRAWAELVAPRASGEYAGSFHVERVTVQAGRKNEDRAGAVLYNDAPHAHVVEARSRVLNRAANVIEGGGG